MAAQSSILCFIFVSMIGISYPQETQCSGKIDDLCLFESNCCEGICHQGKCIEEPCNLMGVCLNNQSCTNYDDCSVCPCRRAGACFLPTECREINCKCNVWGDCLSGCCHQGKCVEDPDQSICNPCCLVNCENSNSSCALVQIYCFTRPCNPYPVCVVDPPPEAPSKECPQGKIHKVYPGCDPKSQECQLCVIPATKRVEQ